MWGSLLKRMGLFYLWVAIMLEGMLLLVWRLWRRMTSNVRLVRLLWCRWWSHEERRGKLIHPKCNQVREEKGKKVKNGQINLFYLLSFLKLRLSTPMDAGCRGVLHPKLFHAIDWWLGVPHIQFFYTPLFLNRTNVWCVSWSTRTKVP